MKKLKKKKKDPKKKPTDSQIRRNRIIFGACTTAAFAVVFGLIYGYTCVSPRWRENKALKLIRSEDNQERISGMWRVATGRMVQHTDKVCTILAGDSSVKVRKSAPLALAKLNDRRAVPCVIYALGDRSNDVAEAAMQALRRMLGEDFAWDRVVDWWQAHESEYQDAIDHPGGMPVVSAMGKLMEDEKYYVRLVAVKRLALLAHPAARPLLERAAADPSEKVREAAEEALKRLSARIKDEG